MTGTWPEGSPTVLRMILARQLQVLRETTGMSFEQAARAIDSSESTIRRMERAEGGLEPLTVNSLLMAYGVTDAGEIDAFLALSRDASRPGWWHSYDDVLPSWFRAAVGLEESASLIRAYEPQVVPGLLQTEGYIRAITAASSPAATEDFTERAVALRLARQQLLGRPDPPEYRVVLDETVLRRTIGGHKVMRAQLEHLIQAAGQPQVTIQVIPFAAGWHPALYGMFNIFRFPAAQLPDIVYTEALTGAYYLDKPDESARYTEALDRMCAQAASPERTVTILGEIAKET
jgi:transcriptional regulator with XRE-family HTH domain